MSRKVKPPLSPSFETIAGRMAWLLDKVWRGSQSDMAKAIGVRPGSMSNVMTGKRAPGREIIARLAAYPMVNAAWLMTGEGTPLAGGHVGPESGPGLPIAATPFIGRPADHPEFLEPGLFPVPPWLYRPSRYWLRIPAGHPFVGDAELRLGADDLLLMEPDADSWPAQLISKPCIASVKMAKSDVLLPCRVSCGDSTSVASSNADFYGRLDGDKYHVDADGTRRLKRAIQSARSGAVRKATSIPEFRLVAVGIFRCGTC